MATANNPNRPVYEAASSLVGRGWVRVHEPVTDEVVVARFHRGERRKVRIEFADGTWASRNNQAYKMA